MKKMKLAVFGLSLLTIVSCSTAAGNGALIGTGAGAAAGALAGRLIGGGKTGTIVGAAVGATVGATAGTLIGKHMDKVKAEAAAKLAAASVETVDIDGVPAVKVTFDNGILFQVGKAALSTSAQTELTNFANVLTSNADCDVAVLGFASSDGSDATNLKLSQSRAQSVTSFLTGKGVSANQIKKTQGYGEEAAYLVMNADGTENQEASRRVEVYMYASKAMIDAANAGTLK